MRQGRRSNHPLNRTFAYLVPSSNMSALRVLASALEEPLPAIQERAVRALLDRRQRPGLRALIRAYHAVPDAQPILEEHFDTLIPALRDSIADPLDQERENAVDLIRTAGGPRVAYLLGKALRDGVETIRLKAGEGLLAWARDIGRDWKEARLDAERRAALQGPRNALLSPLWEAFRTFDDHRVSAVLAALMHLDPRRLAESLNQIQDSRAPRIGSVLDLVRTDTDPAVMAFVYELLGHPKVSSDALAVLGERSDRPFVGALLDGIDALDREGLRDRLRGLKAVRWLDPSNRDLAGISPSRAAALVRFAGALGLPDEARSELFGQLMGRLSAAARQAMIGALKQLPRETARAAVVAGLHDEDEGVQIAAVRHVLEGGWPDANRLLLDRVNSPFDSVRHLVIRSLSQYSFKRYLESFDKLDPKTRTLAGKAVQRIDDRMLDQLVDEVHALEPQRRFRALRVVETLDLAEDLAPKLLGLLDDPDRVVRATAVKVLGVVRTLEVLRAIITTLGDPDPRVQANVIEVLADVHSEKFIGLLTPFLRHANNRLRANAARALVQLDHLPAREVLFDMLNDPSEPMRLSAAWTLGRVALPGAIALLETVAVEDPSPRVRARAEESAELLKGGAPADVEDEEATETVEP